MDFFRDKIKVDFILFGTQYNGHSCVFYIDHKHTAVYVKSKVQEKGWKKCRGGGEERVKVSV